MLGEELGPKFIDIELPISKKQRTAAALAFYNADNIPKQLWRVQAGEGKSRLTIFLVATILLKTRAHVTVIFADESLKKRDEEQSRAMLSLFEGYENKFKGRYTF